MDLRTDGAFSNPLEVTLPGCTEDADPRVQADVLFSCGC